MLSTTFIAQSKLVMLLETITQLFTLKKRLHALFSDTEKYAPDIKEEHLFTSFPVCLSVLIFAGISTVIKSAKIDVD